MSLHHLLHRVTSRWKSTPKIEEEYYLGEGLETFHNSRHLLDKRFTAAYEYAISMTHVDFQVPQRLSLLAWAGYTAFSNFPRGTFVEIGTGKGFCMSFLLKYLEFDGASPESWLFDTFASNLPTDSINRGEIGAGSLYFSNGLENTKTAFRDFQNVNFVEGLLPDSLLTNMPQDISFLHVDLNDSVVEVESLNLLWGSVSPGALIVFDDYANRGRNSQKVALDNYLEKLGIRVLSTPQGQGLAIKPIRIV